MADDMTSQSIWPLPKFHFEMRWENQVISFQEVTGLETEVQVIEYRSGNNKIFNTIKMPGLTKVGNVTLKKGVANNNKAFLGWYKQIHMGTIRRATIDIFLINESSQPSMQWTLQNAFPTKITSSDMKSDGNEIAIETLEIAYEHMTITNL